MKFKPLARVGILIIATLSAVSCKPKEVTEAEVKDWILKNLSENTKAELKILKESDPKIYKEIENLPAKTLAKLLQDPKSPNILRVPNSTQASKGAADQFLKEVLTKQPPKSALEKIEKLVAKPIWTFSNSTPNLYLRDGQLNNPEDVGLNWTIPLGQTKAICEELRQNCQNSDPQISERAHLLALQIANRLLQGHPDIPQAILGLYWARQSIETLKPEKITPKIQEELQNFVDLSPLDYAYEWEKSFTAKPPS
jgi:hypothetical protein